MFNFRWHARFLAAFLLLFSVFAQQAFGQNQFAQFSKETALKGLDEDDLLKVRLRLQRPTAQGTLNQLGRRTVSLGGGQTATLATIAGHVFANQQQLKQQVRQAPRGVLFGVPMEVDIAYEDPDAYLISKGMRVTVNDPTAVINVTVNGTGYVATNNGDRS